jgi:sulfate/thiosulfate transport system substrate-binding protein
MQRKRRIGSGSSQVFAAMAGRAAVAAAIGATMFLFALAPIHGCKPAKRPDTPKTYTGVKSPASDKAEAPPIELLNVSYDPTRELYKEFNKAFAKHWIEETGQEVTVKQSHGGSGGQARKVIEGLPADIVTLALAYDIDAIHLKTKPPLLPKDWQTRLPNNSAPYTSTIVFLVRKGNPKNVKDWDDLVKPGIEIITPHPKTSGGARWNYLAAWGYVLKKELGDLNKLKHPGEDAEAVGKAQAKAREFVEKLLANVKLLDKGARDATMTFVQRGMGDVLLAWENEAFLAVNELGPDKFKMVVPSISILAEPTVAIVDKNVERKPGAAKVAEAYLKYLYSPEGQTIAAKNYYRPRDLSAVPEQYRRHFAEVELFTIDDVFGGWTKAQAEHFDDGGVFDQIYKAK